MRINAYITALNTALQTIADGASGHFAKGFSWDNRNFADKTLSYPFFTVETSQEKGSDQISTMGSPGLNELDVQARITIFDLYDGTSANAQTAAANFRILMDNTLALVSSETNINLSRNAGLVWSRVVSFKTPPPQMSKVPPLRMGTIDVVGHYLISRIP